MPNAPANLRYLGAIFCNACGEAKLHEPHTGPEATCPTCCSPVNRGLTIDQPELPPNIEISPADLRPSMDPTSVRTRLLLPDGTYVTRAGDRDGPDPRAAVLGAEADLYRAERHAVVLVDDSATHIPRPAADMHRIALESAHRKVAEGIHTVETGPIGAILRESVRRNIDQLARAYSEQATASAAWATLTAAILAAAGGRSVTLAPHDQRHCLWAARRADGATVALAAIVDGEWDGKLLPPPDPQSR